MRNLSSLVTVALLTFSTVAAVGCATTGADDLGAESADSATAGKFDLWQATDGQWHFHLKSGNGAILLTSEAYTNRTGAINGALSVMNNGVDEAQYAVVPAAHGYLLHLLAGNGAIVSFSETYSTKGNATRAIGSCINAVTSYLDKRESVTTGMRFEIAAGATGQYHFNVHAKNGEIVLSSESYTTEAAAYNGAFAVQIDGQVAANYVVSKNAAGGYYFTLTALNGQIIGVSQQYTTKASAQAGVTALVKLLPQLSVF